MSDVPASFWPDELFPSQKVLSPLLILRKVAGELPAKSNNLFEAEVWKLNSDDDFEPGEDNDKTWMVYCLAVIVPGLNRYSREILRVAHLEDQVYPARLTDCESNTFICASQFELESAISRALSSREIRAIFYSLAAKLNEAAVAS